MLHHAPQQHQHPRTAPRCPRASQARGRAALRAARPVRARGRPADRHRRACRGPRGRRAQPGPARCHGDGQDLHHGQDHRGDPAPRDHPRAQQDPRGAALRRVQGLLSRERGRIFRELLRLLPARSLCAADRHLHREGKPDQRGHRPDAPFRDARAARTRRRHHRGVGVVHLRHRLGRDLFGDDAGPRGGQDRRAAALSGRAGRPAIPPQRSGLSARQLPRAGRRGRALARPPRGSGVALFLLRRRA